MFSWHAIPFARLLLPAMAGIFIYEVTQPLKSSLSCIALISILLALILVFFRIRKSKKNLEINESILGISLSFLITSVFIFISVLNDPEMKNTNELKIEKGNFYTICIEGNISEKKTYYSAESVIESVSNVSGKIIPCHIPVIFRFKKSDSHLRFLPGDRFITSKLPYKPNEALIPNDFDYKKYLKRKGILYIISCDEKSCINKSSSSKSIARQAEIFKNRCLDILDANMHNIQNRGIAKALLLGNKDELDSDTSDAFAKTGTLHVLAVSGLHAGLIFMVLNLMFGFLKKTFWARMAKVLIILTGLWFYAFITGLSPSVCRAVIMCSILTVGKMFDRRTNIYNSIYASAFLLLLHNPSLLFDAGFQLSYSAVLGIIFVFPILKNNFAVKNRFFSRITDMLFVTLASQVFTLPLCLYYFHQFPLYFIPGNLLVVPMFTLLLFALILLMAISFIPILAAICVFLIDHVINFNIIFMKQLASLPVSILGPFFPDLHVMTFVYLMIFLILGFYIHRQKYHVFLFLSVLCLFSLYQCFSKFQQGEQKILVYLPISNYNPLICMRGNKAIIISGDKNHISENHKKGLKNFLIQNGITEFKEAKFSNKLVEPNLCVIPGIGFQFFDRLVTLKNDVHFNRHFRSENDISIKNKNDPKIAIYYSNCLNTKYLYTFNTQDNYKIKYLQKYDCIQLKSNENFILKID